MKTHGPVQERVSRENYLGIDGTLYHYKYDYPDGSRELLEDYGDHFNVYWSVNPNGDRLDAAMSFADIARTKLASEVFDCEIGPGREGSVLTSDSIHRLDDLVGDRDRWRVTCDEGTFYWEELEGGVIVAGTIAYRDAPTAPIIAWQQATASEAITTRGAFTLDHVSAEAPVVGEQGHAEQTKKLFTEGEVKIPELNGKPYERGDWKRLPEIVHDEHNIKGFFGDYRFLSNFGPATVVLDGVEYASVERAYQAAKWPVDQRQFFVGCTNLESIEYNRTYPPTGYGHEEWDVVKVAVMAGLLVQKFDPEKNPKNYERLIATGDRYIEETNWWGDEFWGKTLEGVGENMLGTLLMTIRDRHHSLSANNS